ncbi:MCM2/3/5 family-domain-containing protein [Chytridium lagenaria]|nr:MCM2/3/5 family-domain-containing protein [Chytridium lagenaria]
MLKRPTPQPPSTQRQPKRIKPHCPYPDWSLYFQEGKGISLTSHHSKPRRYPRVQRHHDLIPLIKAAKEYFSKYSTKDQDLNGDIILLNYQHLKRFCGFDGLVEDLVTRPQTFFNSIALAAVAALAEENWEAHLVKRKKSVRLLEYDVITPLKALKANLIGRFISVKGTIVRVSSIKPMITRMVFQCQTCQRQFEEELADGKHSAPKRCVIISCRGKMFQPILSGNGTVAVDWQRIRIQEKLADDQFDSGRIPRTVECEMMDDLVDNVVPGTWSALQDSQALAIEEGKMKSSKTTSMYSLYISANSLIKASAKSADVGEGSEEADAPLSKDFVQFSRKDLYGIRKIHEDQENIFRFWHSPYSLGGRNRSSDDNKSLTIRSNPHVLIVGDPGLGKSQMLSATTKVAPRGVYVCGNTATTSGLTVTICKDGDTGDTALEAGALVLGDKGAMEQQSISIAKAGIVCTLPARASVIAAANPVEGITRRLRLGAGEEFDPVPHSLLRKYIAYARKYVDPVLTPEAAVALQEFYLNLRKTHRSGDGNPITTRQLESLIRLSEARARSELRQKVTKEDAEDVIFIMKSCLWGTFENEFGDYSFLWKGTGMSRKGDPKRFIAGLSQRAEQSGCSQFTYNELLTIAKEMGLKVDKFGDMLDSLNNQGYLLKKANRMYALSIRVEVPVLVRPSETGLSLENLRQYVRIPEIFLNEERELFQSVTNIEGDTLAERKLLRVIIVDLT